MSPIWLNVVQGSAAQLPFPDHSFDLVYTVLALEQMEEIRGLALSELQRVSRRHVLMIEPFWEYNPPGIRRDYILANHYFDATLPNLEAFGLHVVFAKELPAKLHRGVGAVLTRVQLAQRVPAIAITKLREKAHLRAIPLSPPLQFRLWK